VTEENRRRNIADEIARADQAMQAARALVALRLHADAISRAYYAAFHCLRGLLLSRGLEAKTHAGAIHLFNTEFVRSGLVASSHNRLLAGIERSRELADYDAAVTFSTQDAEACVADAETFRRDALALLRVDGWITPPT
jgi:uncharacterized protein (UPF0332 family)